MHKENTVGFLSDKKQKTKGKEKKRRRCSGARAADASSVKQKSGPTLSGPDRSPRESNYEKMNPNENGHEREFHE